MSRFGLAPVSSAHKIKALIVSSEVIASAQKLSFLFGASGLKD